MILSAKTKRAKKFETFLRYLIDDIRNGKAGYLPQRIYLQLAIEMNFVMGDAKSPEYDRTKGLLDIARAPYGKLWPQSRLFKLMSRNSVDRSRSPSSLALTKSIDSVAYDYEKKDAVWYDMFMNLYAFAKDLYGIDMNDHLHSIKLILTYETDVDYLGVKP